MRELGAKIESTINIHLTKLNQVEGIVEDYNRIAKLNDVILRDISYKDNEKLQNISDPNWRSCWI